MKLIVVSDSGMEYTAIESFSEQDSLNTETIKAGIAKAIVELKSIEYDRNFGDDKICKCGHPYYRHFDTYDHMRPVGCKYCHGTCYEFKQ